MDIAEKYFKISQESTPKKLTISKKKNYKDRLRSSKTKVALKKGENKTKQRKSHISWVSIPYIPHLNEEL